MLKIKLARYGKRKQPEYRIVVNEAKTKRDGKYIELLGHYSPTRDPKVLEINTKLYDEWVSKGAKPTKTVAYLYHQYQQGTTLTPKRNKKTKKQRDADKSSQESAPKTEAS